MTTVGRWSPNKVRKRVLDGTWVDTEALGGMVLMTPTSIASTGSGNSSSIGANGSVTFSSCATLSLNGVFTSSYDNYMIVARGTGSSLTGVTARLRASGSDASGSNYTYQYLYATSTSVTGARTSSGTFFDICAAWGSGSTQSGDTIYFFGPYLSQPTAMRSVDISGDTTNNGRIFDVATTHSLSTSYDGFSLIPTSASITGLVSVYGLVGA